MPVTFNSLVAESTNRCNARCSMCYQSCGPNGPDGRGAAELGRAELERVIREAIAIETLTPRFHLAGGEPFLDVETALYLFAVARETGYVEVTAVTNAFWARRRSRAFEIVRRARGAGLTSLDISWDFWHRAWIEPEAVANCLEACHENDVETNLRVLTTRLHPVREALSFLPRPAVEKATRIISGPVFASGRATLLLDPEEFYASQTSLDESCHTTLNLTVNALGDVYVCCAGMDQTDTYVIGNIKRQSIVDVAEAITSSPVIRTVVFRGIAALAGIIEERGVAVGRDYRSICQMCRSVFSRPECVEAAADHFVEVGRRVLEQVVARLEGREDDPGRRPHEA